MAAAAPDAAKAKEAATDADIAERVNALKREIESGNAAPPPKKVDVPVPPKSTQPKPQQQQPETPPRP
jgi:hypothetical protein